LRVLIYEPSYLRLKARIDALGPRVEPLVMDPAGEVTLGGKSLAADDVQPEVGWLNADVFGSPAMRPFSRILRGPGVRWVQSGAAGFDHRIFRDIVDAGARLTTTHAQAVGMSEYVLHGVLDAFQRGDERRASQAGKRWERHPFREVYGSRWVVVGFGAIGRAVAERARAFDAHVTGVRRNQAADPAADQLAPPAELLKLLPDADVVVLSCPLTAETRHIANAAFFAAMKPGSVFVNVGRGGLQDEPALLAALDRGAPGRAVLDVFETEPLPTDSPFWTHPAVALSPHASGITSGYASRSDDMFVENLRRYLAGEPLKNEADPKDVQA
jgi:phosphoglycerate dehydrogenase-like enzyme